MLKKPAHWTFYYACINLAVVWTIRLLVNGTCLD